MTTFPAVSDERRHQLLSPDAGPLRVLIDTDAANEIDDQFALAWALLSPERLSIESVVAAPYSFAHLREPLLAAAAELDRDPSTVAVDDLHAWAARLQAAGIDPADVPFVSAAEGMELSYSEIVTVYSKLGVGCDGRVSRGSSRYMTDPGRPVPSEGVDRIVELALADDPRPLYVVAIGAATDVASALVTAPEIASRIVVTWTSAYPSWVDLPNSASLNFAQDPVASRLLFDSGVPLVYLPGFHIGAQLRLSEPEMAAWVRGRGAIGDYLHHLYTHNPIHAQRAISPFPGQSWVIWDLINVAWLLDPAWVPSRSAPTPTVDEDLVWQQRPGAPFMLEAVGIDRDAIFRDFLAKLADQDRILAAS